MPAAVDTRDHPRPVDTGDARELPSGSVGRPPIGPAIQIRLPEKVLADIDQLADEKGLSRAETIRMLLGQQLHHARPYAVTIVDQSTAVRATWSTHTSLGAAVVELRAVEAADSEKRQLQGLSSRSPRVEFDGRPVDIESYT